MFTTQANRYHLNSIDALPFKQAMKVIWWDMFNRKKINSFIGLIILGGNVHSAYNVANNLGKCKKNL